MSQSSPAQVSPAEVSLSEFEAVEVLNTLRLSEVPLDWFSAVGLTAALKEAKVRRIEPSDSQLQEEADRVRRDKRLLLKTEMLAWLEHKGLSLDDFEEQVRRIVIFRMLRETLFENRVEQYFTSHPTEFDFAYLAQIVVHREGLAQELLSRIQDDGEPFDRIAQKYSTDMESKLSGGYLGKVRRSDMLPLVESLVFGAAAGQVVGPVKTAAGFHLLKVHAVTRGVMNDQVRQTIKAELFNQWVRRLGQVSNVTCER
jgi:parvulin-like peptidyl-prolyl isomerase